MKLKNKEFHRKWKSPIKWAMFGLIIGAVFATVGSVGALNGWFGGGGSILSDTTTRGLVGYWGFDEGKGQIAYDSSNYSNNGSFGVNTGASTDDPSWNNGKIGGGIKLDGSADYVSVADSASLNVVDAITISAWINPSGWGDTNVGHIVAKSPDGSVNTGYAFYVSQSDTDALKFFANGGGITLFAANAISLNQWQYVTVTYDRQILKLFVNGVLKNSAAETDAISTNNSPLTIGSRATNYYFNGLIDEVRVYNRALSAEEVRYHYNRGGPVAQWKMDEGEGRTVYDSTENNNDGTLVLAGSATSSAWVSGKYGSALNLDGTDDYVKSGSNLTAVSQFSHSLWFKSADGTYSADEYLLSQGANDPSVFIESTDNKVYVMADNANILSSNTLVNDNKWHHAEITADGTVIKLYLDGIFQSQAAYTGSSAAGLLYVGSNATPGSYFGGIVDDVRIYNYARTPDEIRLDYNAGFAARFGPAPDCKTNPGSCMTQGLVGYWDMEEGTGTAIHDSSDYSNNGTTTNMTTPWTSGIVPLSSGKKGGSALSFDGSDDYVAIPTISISNEITAEAWVYSANYNQSMFVVQKAPVNTQWELFFESGFLKWRGGSTDSVNCTDPADNQWHHLTATQSGTTATLYIDGKQCGSGAVAAIGNGTGAIDIGRHDASGYFFNGYIDEARIYNRALSAEEVRYHYNRGGPVAQWKMDEGEGRTVYDSTENNNDGTLVLAGSATSSAWVAGKYGSALNLDGTDDYVKSGSNFTAVSQFSHSLWFKSVDGAYSADEYLLSQGTNDPSIFVESTDNKVYVMADNANILSSNTLVNDNKWHQAEITADGTVIKLYLDGIFQSQAAYTGSSAAGLLYVGSNATPGSYFGGIVDDVRIYNYARTPDEIRLDYNSGFAAKFGYTAASCSAKPSNCMTQGLVGYWPFEEGSSALAHDSSDYANDGVLTSGPSWTKGKVGGGLSFDGTNDYVDAGNGASLNITAAITVEVWVKKSGGDGTYMAPGSKWDSAGGDGDQRSWTLEFRESDDKVQFQTSNNGLDSGAVRAISTTIPVIGTWYHIVGTWDGSNNKIYVNGALEHTIAQTGLFSSLDKVGIGAVIGTGLAVVSKMNGLIDEVRIYNRALSAEEVRYHYNKGGPVAQWKMDEGEGRTVYDSTENNNDGTLILAGSATSSAWVSGKYGSALNLDGTDDYVKSGSNFTAVSQFSHSLWFKSVDGAYSADEYLLSQGTNDPSIFVESTDSKVYVMADGSNILSSNTLVNDNKWHHAEITADGTVIKLYLDGIFQSQAAYTGSSAAGLLYVGSNATPASYFGGIVDDVRIYNYARTPSQVQQDYNAGLSAHFK